jgi:hypothetical protein
MSLHTAYHFNSECNPFLSMLKDTSTLERDTLLQGDQSLDRLCIISSSIRTRIY